MTRVRRTLARVVGVIRKVMNRPTTWGQVLPAYVALASGFIGAVWYADSLSAERARSACQTLADARSDNRTQWLATYQFFDDRDPSSVEVTGPLRNLLDVNLPPLNRDDC